MTEDNTENLLTIELKDGTVEIELFPEDAPKTRQDAPRTPLVVSSSPTGRAQDDPRRPEKHQDAPIRRS